MLRLLWIFGVSLSLVTSTDMKKGQIGKEDASKNDTMRGKSNENVQVKEPRFEYLRLGDFINPLKKEYPREVTKLIFVTNGGSNGDWQRPQFCPKGTYAAGYEIKLEDPMWFKSDDTALNAVSLKCVRPGSRNYEGHITSMEGFWGVWKESVDCVNPEGQNYFLVGFNLKVEKSRGIRDDTAANDIKFVCRLLNQYRHYQLSGKGGPWGKWGDWSERCPMGSAVCGVQVKMQEPRGPKDDTSLNDIRLFCCKGEQEDNRPSREEWIKLCNVKVQTGPGAPTPGSPAERNRDGGRLARERFDSKGNRIWPPVDKSKSGDGVFVGDRSPPTYRRADSAYPGLKEDMDDTEVFVHDFH